MLAVFRRRVFVDNQAKSAPDRVVTSWHMSFLGVRNGGGMAWAIAFAVAGGVFVYPEYEKWSKDRALNEKLALGEQLMRSGETSERYKAFVKENSKKTSKNGWFNSGK
jgi:hypothetical protein